MNKKLINVDLKELAEGAVQEKLDHVMEEVLENVMNPNTEAKKKRKVTISLTMTPSENRDTVTVDAQVKATLTPENSATATLLVGVNGDGAVEANELKSGAKGQTYFDPDDAKLKDDKGEEIDEVEKSSKPKIVDFQKQKKEAN